MLHLRLEGVVIRIANRSEAGRIQRRQVRLCRLESGDRGCVDAGGIAGCLPDKCRQRVVDLDRTWIDASGEVAGAPRGPYCRVNSERLSTAVDEESTPRKSTAHRADVTDVHEPGGTQLTLDV